MIAYHFDSLILITVVQYGTVIAGQDNQGILRQSQFIQFFQELSHTPVSLQDDISARSHTRFADKLLIRYTGHMRLV